MSFLILWSKGSTINQVRQIGFHEKMLKNFGSGFHVHQKSDESILFEFVFGWQHLFLGGVFPFEFLRFIIAAETKNFQEKYIKNDVDLTNKSLTHIKEES